MKKLVFSKIKLLYQGAIILMVLIVVGCTKSKWPIDAVILHADYDKIAPGFYEADSNPRIVTDQKNNWIVAWTGNSRAKQTGGANCPTGGVKYNMIYSIYSTDNGKTWGTPKCLTKGDHNTSPALATDGKGNYLIVWQAENTMPSTDTDIYCAMSSNTTWGYPAPSSPWGSGIALNTNAGTDQGYDYYPEVIWNGTNKWVVVWASNEPLSNPGVGSDMDIFVSSSTDGKTWTAPKALNTNATNDTGHDTNPHITSDGKGNLIAVWDSTDELGSNKLGTDNDIFFATSADGISWSNPKPLNTNAASDKGNDSNPTISFINNKWNVTWVSDDDLKNTIGTDHDILFSYGSVKGSSWQPPQPVIGYMKTDKGNDLAPYLASGGGKVYCVWHTDTDVGSKPSTVGTDSDIVMAQSYDDGASWYFNSVIHTYGLSDNKNDGTPFHATDGKGKWIVVWSSDFSGPSGNWGIDYDILAVSFTDK